MVAIARIPISNVHMAGLYTASIKVGPDGKALNVMLDTGSSALVVKHSKYKPIIPEPDQATQLAQFVRYGDGSSWTGAIIKTVVATGRGTSGITAKGVNVAVAYETRKKPFGSADGILGLAKASLDLAFEMRGLTWPRKYSAASIARGKKKDVAPFLLQLSRQGKVLRKIAFYTKRSFVHMGRGGAADPLNKGLVIVGGGEESKDLYSGRFQSAKVLAGGWYSTNLKSVIVGKAAPIRVRAKGRTGNSVVDSGTNSLHLGPKLLNEILSRFTAEQQAQLKTSIFSRRSVPVEQLDLESWPDIVFILEGTGSDVELRVGPSTYWQVNAPRAGSAKAAFTKAQESVQVLGLPLMNGYFTVFDGTVGTTGVIKFATRKG